MPEVVYRTFPEWAYEHLGPEVMGVIDWTQFEDCWEAAQAAMREDEES